MATCYLCRSKNIQELMDLGQQPICNRFLTERGQPGTTYPMILNQCHNCGLIQINDPVPADELRPRYDWITYHELEKHLDHLVDIIKNLPGISSQSSFGGVSFKDDSTLMRLQKLGFSNTRRLDLKDDLNIDQKGVGIETIQAHLTPERALKFTQKYGKFDVIIARHIFEHVHDIAGFIEALKILAKKDGYIVFEIPDSCQALDTYDYTTLWEEHTLYFTPETFQNSLHLAGFLLERYELYPDSFLNSLVGIVHAHKKGESSPALKINLNRELERAHSFARQLPIIAGSLQRLLGEYRKNDGKIAVFGAGHFACTFVSVLGIKDYIDFFVDDNPHKRGLFMPGCQLPIHEPVALNRENVKLCLLSINTLSEEKVLRVHQGWPGTFFSIFPSTQLTCVYQKALDKKGSYAV